MRNQLFLQVSLILSAAAAVLTGGEQLPLNLNALDRKVPVQLGVMSRCPDALVCETVFDSVLAKVADKVDLSLVFLAKLNASDVDFGVTCLHGPQECAGNVQQLCVAAYSSFTQFWQFVQCNNYHGRWEIGSPEVAFSCARASGIEWDGPLADCAGSDASGKTAEGISRLKESARQAEAMGIINSCTVFINGKAVCVRDSTWRDCEGGHTANDFVRQISEEYDHINT